MNRFTKISFIFGLSMVGVIIFFIGYLQIILLTYTDYGLINEFPDSQSKFYDEGEYFVTDRKLTNTKRDKVIFPNDELMYSFQVHNLKDYRTNIDYELEFFTGGVREEPIYSGSGQLEPKSNKIQVIKKIYLKTPGSYDVKLNLFFKNSTDEKYAQYSPGFDDIEILSRSEQLQIEQNDYLLIGVIASSFIGGGTITALAFSVYFSRKEVSHLETQARTEKRPWLGATTMMSYRQDPARLIFHYKNYGKLPANNVQERHSFSFELITRDSFQRPTSEVPHTSLLLPEQTADFTIGGLPENVINRIEHGPGPLYIWIGIEFTYDTDKRGKYEVIFEYKHDVRVFDVKEEWAE